MVWYSGVNFIFHEDIQLSYTICWKYSLFPLSFWHSFWKSINHMWRCISDLSSLPLVYISILYISTPFSWSFVVVWNQEVGVLQLLFFFKIVLNSAPWISIWIFHRTEIEPIPAKKGAVAILTGMLQQSFISWSSFMRSLKGQRRHKIIIYLTDKKIEPKKKQCI